jgi:hypothetical protein
MRCPYYEKMPVSQDITKGGWQRHGHILDSQVLGTIPFTRQKNNKTPGLIQRIESRKS